MQIVYSNTSSHGNCSVIESKSGHLIIIDAGLKYCQVDKEVGYRLHKADALLITHAHNDHIQYIKEFLLCGSTLFIGISTSDYIDWYAYRTHINIDKSIETKGFIIRPLEMVHTNSDGTPCECYGFLIMDKSTGEKMLWATDTKFIKNKFPQLDYYCIESNYFESDDYNEDIDYIEKKVEQRRLQSHMSFESAVKFLKMQDLSKCKEIRLLHLSTSLSEKDKKKMKRKLRSELRSEINWKEVNLVV